MTDNENFMKIFGLNKYKKILQKPIINNTDNTFDWKYYINNYSDLTKVGINTYHKALVHWNKYGKNEGRKCNKLIIIWAPPFHNNSGGIKALYTLAKYINELKYDYFTAKIYVCSKIIDNNVSNDYLYNKESITNDNIVIYPEIVLDNPLNGKKIIRWLLLDKYNNTNWGTDDIYYSWEPSNIYKQLITIHINPDFYNKNYESRNKTCYIIRKALKFHTKIENYHPCDSIQIDELSIGEIVEIFNTSKYFYCYDPNCFFVFYAVICGCIVVLQPLENVTKIEYLSNRITNYNNNIFDYGIAYGNIDEELLHATKTLPDAVTKFNDLKEYYNNHNMVKSFLDDMNAKFYSNN